MEFIIGDSAFNPSKRMIIPHKKSAGQLCLKAEKEFFDSKLSNAWNKYEHCIGLMKNYFMCLHGLNVRIKKGTWHKTCGEYFYGLYYITQSTLIWARYSEQCEEDIGLEVDGDTLYGREVCLDENRREQVKHSLIELLNAAPL